MTAEKNHRDTQGAINPIALVRPVVSAAADGEGKYPSCCAASSTASLVLADTPGRPRSARDTVAGENPDNAATSTMPAGSNVGPDMAFCLPILFLASALDAAGQ